MNKMKFASLMIGLTGILSLIGCAPSFQSMRDVDDFLAKEKVLAREHSQNMRSEENIESLISGKYVSVWAPTTRSKDTGVSMGLSAANLLVGNYGMAAASAIGGGPSVHKEITGVVVGFLDRYHGLYTRKDVDSLGWDMGVEAVKIVGPPPASNACIFEGIRTAPMNANQYKGNDGEAITANGAFIYVWFSSKPDATVRCDKNSWGIYSDYVRKVGMQMQRLAWKQFADDGKDMPEFAVRK